MKDSRPDPSLLLTRLREEEGTGRGHLKIFFGASAGVGKTYSMLQAAGKLKNEGVDVVVGCAETHGRAETALLLEHLEILPRVSVEYRGTTLAEFDIDAALARKPQLILVDELAHSNAPGSRHAKRWQDVQELIEAGIDVFSTLNVQHIESLHDVVSQITGVFVQERIPDSLLESAAEFELVDLPPDELIQRLRDGKIYVSERAESALNNFFRKGNPIALRELALRYTAEHVDSEMLRYRHAHQIVEPWPTTERMLVCVSNSPLSIRLVRASKRMAVALKAKWYVAFVETPSYLRLPDSEKARVLKTLRMAEQLGAETLELSGDNVSEELVRWAHSNNVTKIVIGKPAQPRWLEVLRGSIVDDIVRKSGMIDVYVITGDADAAAAPWVKKVRATRRPKEYLGSSAIVALCTAIAALMTGHFELSNVIMVYMLGIVIVASQYGRGPAVFASVISVASFDFFFVPPFYTFAVSDTQYLVTFAVMLTIALVISTLTARIRQQAQSARLRESRTASLYLMSRELSSTLNLDDLITIGLRHVAEVFDSKVAIYLPNFEGVLQVRIPLEGLDAGVAVWAFKNKQPAGLSTSTLPAASALYVPLFGAKAVIGVLAIRPSDLERFLAPEQLHLLETFGNQIAIALERAQLADDNERARLQVKAEQLRNSLLSSVSHDLRTPLATITGAASTIMEGSASLTVEKCRDMAAEIFHESERLNRLVGNLLDMTKVQSGNLKVRKEWCPIDEIIGAALSYVDDRLNDRPVRILIPSDLPLIPVDSILIQQVLVNLLENALKYTPAGSELVLRASVSDRVAQLEVADRGPGIPPAHIEKIFEKFFREERSDRTGVGLGLAICSGIVEAHGGKIWVENRAGGGAVFKFTLPIEGIPNLDQLENIND
jgi:two-component system sensor histidine kinase KdpD